MLRKPSARGLPSGRLTQPLLLEDGRPPGILTSTIYTISGFTLAVVVWGALTDVREMTVAAGQIVPRGQIQAIQHLEGGIVAEIMAREGETVVTGQPLLRLQPAAAESDRNQLESRRAGLTLQLIRLNAESQDTVPDFGPLARDYSNLAQEQANLYASNLLQRRKEKATLSARIAQRKSERNVVQADLETAKAQLTVQREQFQIQNELVKQGYTAKKTFLDAKLALQRAAGEVTNYEGKLRTAAEAVSEAESNLAEAEANAAKKVAEERAKAAAELSETEQQLAKFTDRVDRLYVRASSDGVIQEIVPKGVGEVVKPGDMVARIVPSGYELIAEVRVESKDAGHVQVGARADVKFMTFDSAVYGTVPGVVEYMSATSITPSPGAVWPGQRPGDVYYKATIALSKNHVGVEGRRRPIVPGLTVQANIVTGSKSILRYMFKPVFNAIDVAFTER